MHGSEKVIHRCIWNDQFVPQGENNCLRSLFLRLWANIFLKNPKITVLPLRIGPIYRKIPLPLDSMDQSR